MTQLAIDIKPTAPLRSAPTATMRECPVRDRCHKYAGYRCGFEQVGTVEACPKKRRLEGR